MSYKLLSRFGFTFQSHFFCDSVSKSLAQQIFESTLRKSKEFLSSFQVRNVVKKSPALVKSSKLRVFKSAFPYYRPGLLNEASSRWVRQSIASTIAKNFRQRALQRGSGLCFVGFVLANKNSLLTDEEELEGFTYAVRDVFSEVPWDNGKASNILNSVKLEDLKIGNLISKGCFAAVHSAKYVGPNCGSLHSEEKLLIDQDLSDEEDFISEEKVQDAEDTTPNSKLFISHSDVPENSDLQNGGKAKSPPSLTQDDLAVKMMFNYDVESNACAIWNAMYKETLPLSGHFSLESCQILGGRKKRLPPHPNIVEMYCAFEGAAVLLPGALGYYPDALPVRLREGGCGRNMTLFLVMKRYDTSLRDYLSHEGPLPPRTSLLLLTQLLEAVTHLHQNGVAHRDLKADNLLLDLSSGSASPRLVVADFGCSSESLFLHYTSRDLNAGNVSLMAPEVVTKIPGPFAILDFSRSDLWTSGTLAYEMYGGRNPFGPPSALKSSFYEEGDLPRMPQQTPPPVEKLVREMLRVNPKKRPSPSLAATVCQLLLHAPPAFFYGKSEDFSRFVLDISTRTYLESFSPSSDSQSTDYLLRHTFCTRMQYSEILRAFEFIKEALLDTSD